MEELLSLQFGAGRLGHQEVEPPGGKSWKETSSSFVSTTLSTDESRSLLGAEENTRLPDAITLFLTQKHPPRLTSGKKQENNKKYLKTGESSGRQMTALASKPLWESLGIHRVQKAAANTRRYFSFFFSHSFFPNGDRYKKLK